MMAAMRRVGSGLLVVLLWSSSAAAQNVKDSSRAAARDLGYSGVESYQSGDYATALAKLDKAYQVLQVPTLGLWSARARLKTNRWVEAAERLRQVLALEVRGGDAAVQQQAVSDAKQELEALTPRIPSLSIDVKGAPSAATVTVDGDVISSALIGEALPSNPGRHVIVARAGEREVTRDVTLQEGERERVELSFEPVEPAHATTGDTAPTPSGAATAGDEGPPRSTRKTLAWVLVGTGAAGLAVGATTGFMAIGKKSSLEDSTACRGQRCLQSQSDNVNSFNSMRTISGVGLIAGTALAAAGVVLVVTAPKAAPANEHSSLRLRVTPSSLLAEGVF